MLQPMFTRLAPLVLATGAALGGSACVDIVAHNPNYVEREEKQFSVSGATSLTLATFDGAIEVTTWDHPEVQVVVEKRGADRDAVAAIRTELQQMGDRISIEATRGSGEQETFGWRRHLGATLFVTVPAAAAIQATTGDGHISVRDVRGDIILKTGDGSIRADEIEGNVDAQSGDGSIRVRGRLTGVRARSGDGSVTIHAGEGSTAEDDWTISTGDGSVTLELPPAFDAEVDAHTGSGRVRADDLAFAMVRRDDRGTLRGRLGHGGRDLHVRTGDGSITIRRN